MTAERTADPLGRRILRTADALIRSMKTRVFLAAFAVALVPLAGLTGWGLLLQKDQLAAERSEAAHLTPGVHAAWDTIADNQTAHAMESLATMGTRLSPAAFRALAARVAILMESSHGNYTSMRTEPAALSRAQGLLHGNAGMLARLQSQGYVWGDATYWYPDPHWDPGRLSAAWNREPSWMGEDTPFVAWMPAEGTVWYLQVTSANENPPHGVPRWWIAAVIGVMLAIIAGCAIIAMLLATRGVAKPLKRMAQASDRLAADRPVEPVPVKGPSEVRRATRAFNAMTAHLTRAQDTEQQFLLSVTHELKTPLTSIRGYGEALAEGAVSGDEAGPVVAEEAGRMQRLVQDLLDLGRAHKSTFGVRHEAVDLAQVAREAVRRLVPRAEEYRVELIAAVPDDDEVAGRSGIEAIADGD
ncbi:MAG: HAMP domain-containing histidine kinase, partial [Actinobacteria bacterium]|nr:HAMP domain-containing histidine kinase [Actinomycetota bacterium]